MSARDNERFGDVLGREMTEIRKTLATKFLRKFCKELPEDSRLVIHEEVYPTDGGFGCTYIDRGPMIREEGRRNPHWFRIKHNILVRENGTQYASREITTLMALSDDKPRLTVNGVVMNVIYI